MSHAYTPGLKIKSATVLSKARVLPIPGEVLVREGQDVAGDTVVARASIAGNISTRPIAYEVGVEPKELPRVMQKKVGEPVSEGEVIATSKGLFGLFKSEARAWMDGTIELISDSTGMVAIREKPHMLNLLAYIPGRIARIIPQFGCVVETKASIVQGIFGVGGERQGILKVVAGPSEALTEDLVSQECKGKILVGGSIATLPFLKKAENMGVKGIVTGGIDRESLTSLLGVELGVAITGAEEIDITVIVTEGFGEMTMSTHAFDLLKSLDGKWAAMDGATQIRAGVIRPEVIVPLEGETTSYVSEEEVKWHDYRNTCQNHT